MKNLFLFVALAGVIFMTSSCTHEVINPSNLITKQSKNFEGYDHIAVSSEFETFVTISPGEESIEIEANENLHERIEVKKTGNTLYIGLKNNTSIRGDQTLRAYITTSYVNQFSASGQSFIELQNELHVDKCVVDLSGESKFAAKLFADEFDGDLSGESKLDIEGMSTKFKAKFSGSSLLRNFDFVSDYSDVELHGDCDVSMTVHKEIRIEASGDSEYRYKGDAVVVHQSLSGDAKIIKLD